MTLLEEYMSQNKWRDWERYIKRLPLGDHQVVYDLGCSIGYVTGLLAPEVKKVIGIDQERVLLDEARKNQPNNCEFLLENIFSMNPQTLEECDGIWLSFTLAYINDPQLFLSRWVECLSPGGWFAVVDIDGLFSSHLSKNNRFFRKTEAFETEQERGKQYDFRVGRKIKRLLENSGLEIIVAEENWYDRELNFSNKADPDIVKGWEARLERMVSLKAYFGSQYSEFCACFLSSLQQESHVSNGAVKFYVGIKR